MPSFTKEANVSRGPGLQLQQDIWSRKSPTQVVMKWSKSKRKPFPKRKQTEALRYTLLTPHQAGSKEGAPEKPPPAAARTHARTPLTSLASPRLSSPRASLTSHYISTPQRRRPSHFLVGPHLRDRTRGNGSAGAALGGGEGARGGALGTAVAGHVVRGGDGEGNGEREGEGEGGGRWGCWVGALGGAGVLRLPQVHLRRRHAPCPPRRRRRHPHRPRPAHGTGQCDSPFLLLFFQSASSERSVMPLMRSLGGDWAALL